MIRFYNIFLGLLGIHTKLLDFHGAFNGGSNPKVKPLKKVLLKLISAIIFIAFVLHYPVLVENIMTHIPFKKSKKHLEFFVYYGHFYSKYAVIIVIYIFELLTTKSTIRHQKRIERILLRLGDIYSFWSQQSNKNDFKSKSLRETLTHLSILTKLRVLKIILVVFCCVLFNSLKLEFIFHNSDDEHFYDFFFGSLPNVFISLFVLHASTIIAQHRKLFRLLNKIIEVVASDIAKRTSGSVNEQHWMGKSSGTRFNGRNDERQLQTAINNITTLIETHDELRANITKLRKLHSIQLNAVVLNSFLNIIFEVRTHFTQRFIERFFYAEFEYFIA